MNKCAVIESSMSKKKACVFNGELDLQLLNYVHGLVANLWNNKNSELWDIVADYLSAYLQATEPSTSRPPCTARTLKDRTNKLHI